MNLHTSLPYSLLLISESSIGNPLSSCQPFWLWPRGFSRTRVSRITAERIEKESVKFMIYKEILNTFVTCPQNMCNIKPVINFIIICCLDKNCEPSSAVRKIYQECVHVRLEIFDKNLLFCAGCYEEIFWLREQYPVNHEILKLSARSYQ